MTCDRHQLEETSQIFPLCNFTDSRSSKSDTDLFWYSHKNMHGMPVRFSLSLLPPPHQTQNSPLFRLPRSSASAPTSSPPIPFSFPDISVQHHAPSRGSATSLHTTQLTKLPFLCRSLPRATQRTLLHQLHQSILKRYRENGRDPVSGYVPPVFLVVSSLSCITLCSIIQTTIIQSLTLQTHKRRSEGCLINDTNSSLCSNTNEASFPTAMHLEVEQQP